MSSQIIADSIPAIVFLDCTIKEKIQEQQILALKLVQLWNCSNIYSQWFIYELHF